MKIGLIVICCLLYSTTYSQNELLFNNNELKLNKNNAFKQLKRTDEQLLRFDLSGIVMVDTNIYIVADKNWNNAIYVADISLNSWTIKDSVVFDSSGYSNIDYEAIDFWDNYFYLADEKNSRVLKISSTGQCDTLKIDWWKQEIRTQNWGNAGIEGIAISSKENSLYIAKERDPCRIFRYNLKTEKLTEPFDSLLKTLETRVDISDMKCENGILYAVNRSNCQILRIDIENSSIQTVSYKTTCFPDGMRLYINKIPKFGMIESLLLTKDEIWLGFDNNNDKVSKQGYKLGLKKNREPAILIFKRPKGF